ncbi:hypothetical protein SanaruYs_06570 [Chryseotalea sanaruensis]|uniref:Uncharacterized protein n=1 Tax=Chryseotalea sanaruensis TaxID=2482724 RepID=A0A401U6G3_9BACT|nr:hypothetical protein [Chryseotalea sanaruensis]GCC50442.1 hypothetical protein SanaruYs_06570 [Chryseotalea sanaruensis]
MTKSFLIFLVLTLKFQAACSQMNGYYKSNDPGYFPTYLCLDTKDISTFCIIEVMGKQHPDNIYFEKGNYILNGDSIFFRINEAGFDSGSLIKVNYIKKGFLENEAIFLLNEKGERYLKLKGRKRFSSNAFCKECLP